jgi:hypothetical protein
MFTFGSCEEGCDVGIEFAVDCWLEPGAAWAGEAWDVAGIEVVDGRGSGRGVACLGDNSRTHFIAGGSSKSIADSSSISVCSPPPLLEDEGAGIDCW